MDIGGAFCIGVEDDLIDELHDDAVRFSDDFLLLLIGHIFGVQFAEDIGEGMLIFGDGRTS